MDIRDEFYDEFYDRFGDEICDEYRSRWYHWLTAPLAAGIIYLIMLIAFLRYRCGFVDYFRR